MKSPLRNLLKFLSFFAKFAIKLGIVVGLLIWCGLVELDEKIVT